MPNRFAHGYAVLIAVNESREPRAALPAVLKDVQALRNVLVHPERCAYPADHVKLIAGAGSTRDGIMAGLDWLRDKLRADASGDATAVIYYTGHGHVEGGAHYLIPYNVNLSDIENSAIRAEDFAARVAAIQPRRLLVILDCCHAAGMQVKAPGLPLNPAAIPAGLFMQGEKALAPQAGVERFEMLAQGSGRAVLSSSQGDQQSYMRRDSAMSIFTYHLIEALTGHAQPADGAHEVLVSDVISHVWRTVPASAREDWGKPQTPDCQISGNFPVALLLGGKGLSKGDRAPDPLRRPITAILCGDGAIAQALQKAIALATRAVYIEGGNAGVANTGFMLTINHYRGSGNRKLSKRELAHHIHRYLEKMLEFASEAPFPFGRDKLDAVRIPLDAQTTSDDGAVRRLNADWLLSDQPRRHIVLLAGPGQGKSLTLLTLARLMSEHLLTKRDRLDARLVRKQTGFDGYRDLALPLYVPLNVYASELAAKGANVNRLVEFLGERLKGAAPDLPDDFAHALITADQPLVLLLDGLDEIVDPTLRRIVAEHIRQLGYGTSRVRLVVSSRPSAYGASEDLGAKFRPFTIAPFDPDKRWALLRAIYKRLNPKSGETTAAIVQGEIDALERSQRNAGRPALIDSPLMTVLAVQVRRLNPQHALPTERAAFLAKAIEAMLRSNYALDEREKALIEEAVGGWEEHRRLLAALAYDMHLAHAQEITEKRLRTRLSEAGADAPTADALIKFAQSRGGPLRRRAWGEAGAGQYGFVHLSLQQALTAFHMVERQTPEQLARFFARDGARNGAISTEWWREVAELVAGNLHAGPDNPQGDNDDLRAFVLALAAEAHTPETPPEARFACAELAIAAAEQFLPDHADLRAPLASAAAKAFEDEAAMRSATAARRTALGDALGRLGDPRAGVMDVDAMQFCLVPRGPFIMGSEQFAGEQFAGEQFADERPVHEVNLAHDFWIGQYPVTNAQFNAFVREKGYANLQWWKVARAAGVWRDGRVIQRVYRFDPDALTKETRAEWESLCSQGRYAEADWVLTQAKAGALVEEPVFEPADVPVLGAAMAFADRAATYPNHPIMGITWYEALAFCAWLEARWHARGWLPSTMRVTLPSEAEWEKAARVGLDVPVSARIVTAAQLRNAGPMAMHPNDLPRRDYPWGDSFDPAWANTVESNRQNTSAVGSFPMNRSPYGCVEMSGNVFEWTRSLYGPTTSMHAGQRSNSHTRTRTGRLNAKRSPHRPMSRASCAAARGTTTLTARAAPAASGVLPTAGTTSSGFGWWCGLPLFPSSALCELGAPKL